MTAMGPLIAFHSDHGDGDLVHILVLVLLVLLIVYVARRLL